MALVLNHNRQFEINGRMIDFPFEDGTLDENYKLLIPQIPLLRHTIVLEEDAKLVGDTLVYHVQAPPAKTNG